MEEPSIGTLPKDAQRFVAVQQAEFAEASLSRSPAFSFHQTSWEMIPSDQMEAGASSNWEETAGDWIDTHCSATGLQVLSNNPSPKGDRCDIELNQTLSSTAIHSEDMEHDIGFVWPDEINQELFGNMTGLNDIWKDEEKKIHSPAGTDFDKLMYPQSANVLMRENDPVWCGEISSRPPPRVEGYDIFTLPTKERIASIVNQITTAKGMPSADMPVDSVNVWPDGVISDLFESLTWTNYNREDAEKTHSPARTDLEKRMNPESANEHKEESNLGCSFEIRDVKRNNDCSNTEVKGPTGGPLVDCTNWMETKLYTDTGEPQRKRRPPSISLKRIQGQNTSSSKQMSKLLRSEKAPQMKPHRSSWQSPNHPALAPKPPAHTKRCKQQLIISCARQKTQQRQTSASTYQQDRPFQFLTWNPKVKSTEELIPEEKMQMLENVRRAKALLLTLVYQDGTTQLQSALGVENQSVCGLRLLLINDLDNWLASHSHNQNDLLLYHKLDCSSPEPQQQIFTRDLVLQVLSRAGITVCYGAKELLCTALELNKQHLSWKQVSGSLIQDPQVSAWLLDPADPCFSYQDLLRKHKYTWLSNGTPANVFSELYSLYCLNEMLCSKLKSQGLWRIYSDIELKMIPILAAKVPNQGTSSIKHSKSLKAHHQTKVQSVANSSWSNFYRLTTPGKVHHCSMFFPFVDNGPLTNHNGCEQYPDVAMESQHIQMDKGVWQNMSDLLTTKMNQLESAAHVAAGEYFLITSCNQIRKVLFENLRLHERFNKKRLPSHIAALQKNASNETLQMYRDLHPLPNIILEYRQVQKTKDKFVDWAYVCMKDEGYMSPNWSQTRAVMGRISSNNPNFAAIPRKLIHKRHVTGEEPEVISVNPRAMYIPAKGCTFVAADFCELELRLLAHFSCDPKLLHLLTDPGADIFAILTSEWKWKHTLEVPSEEREQAKRIVSSILYGQGRDGLTCIMGVSALQARQFADNFFLTYQRVKAFTQTIIQQCRRQGFVCSLVGRQRPLQNINSDNATLRLRSEKQAVGFVLQGSAADLCKIAMIQISEIVSTSHTLSARLIAQFKDELLFEVEDAQVEEFAALVKRTMESLSHINHVGVHLNVRLKVAVSRGKSWGSMSALPIPPA
ncbi:DNA polymerase nu isoform X3 [Phyllopteryx taeniolatus]|uniref:DNA polymerase nu isoform X3 n=1 Tax=Phyllopteryx taeniolatus TaxID=161469 RepID=UPI002AD38AD4|nr:DNA polymerase nu isoform X3 [Phyllopteryx taeniolatus]XP_061619382.1 DNA polymerase nu isoform X3 [Phyllopteryx taeniolatus]